MAKVVTINVVINDELERKLKRESKETQRSVSGLVRIILAKHFESGQGVSHAR